jgi:hypothetical protein
MDTDYIPETTDAWQQAPDGSLVYLLRNGFEVHHQYAIVLRFPAYYEPSLVVCCFH